MNSFLRDLQYALRTLAKKPGLSLTAILAFSLGIGLTTAMYSIVHGALDDLPFAEVDRLMHLEQNNLEQGDDSIEVGVHDFLDWRQDQRSFESLAAFYDGTANLSGGDDRPERLSGCFMSVNAFDLIGARPILGRGFLPGEDAPGAQPVAILGYGVWKNRYHSDPAILGKTVRINSVERQVVGVMPEGFAFPVKEQIWLPYIFDPTKGKRGEGATFEVIGRLKHGVSLRQARADLDAASERLAQRYPETNKGVGAVVKPYIEEQIPAGPRRVLRTMLGAVIGVLLIACANVANLLLARAALRGKEIAVRSALGARRGQLVRLLLAETTVLATSGAALGIVFAHFGLAAFNRYIAFSEPPYWLNIRISGPVLGATLVATLAAALVSGLIPALKSSGRRAGEILKDESRGSSSLRLGRLSKGLVIAEIAISCGLLFAAGLMTKSVIKLKLNSFGVDREHVLTARVGLFEQDYPDRDRRAAFFEALLPRLAALPGVRAAALADSLPVSGSGAARIEIEGRTYTAEADYPFARQAAVTPAFFQAVGSRILAGRDFRLDDRRDGDAVIVVNQPFVDRFFPSENPLGKRLRYALRDDAEQAPWMTVVGVVPNLYMGGPDSDSSPKEGFYRPFAQVDRGFVSLVLATSGPPLAITPLVRDEVARLDPNLPIYFVRTLEGTIFRETWFYGVFGTLFIIFGAVALFLAAIGLYGVMSFSVSRRVHEVGIRMALGAEAGQVLGLILRSGSWQLGGGLGLGLLLALGIAQLLQAGLFDVRPWDPTVLVLIVSALSLTGVAACLIPARRASRVDPLVALRQD